MIIRQNLKNFLIMVENSIGSRMFKNLWVMDEKKQDFFDAAENGNLSCAYYVSAILKIFNKAKDYHGTVEGTEVDLKNSGWQEVSLDQLEKGDVLVWEKKAAGKGGEHGHIGFYIGDDWAISNSSENGFPIKHHWNFNGHRKAVRAWRIVW